MTLADKLITTYQYLFAISSLSFLYKFLKYCFLQRITLVRGFLWLFGPKKVKIDAANLNELKLFFAKDYLIENQKNLESILSWMLSN